MYHINSKVDKPDIPKMLTDVTAMMQRGIRVNLSDCIELLNNIDCCFEAFKTTIKTEYGIVNPNSSQQIIAYIRHLSSTFDLGSKNDILNICFDDKTGKWTSRAEALEKLEGKGYSFASDILAYRKYKNYKSTVENIIKNTHKQSLLHPEVSLGKTNRINYANPPLMNIPKELLWKVVKPFKEGNNLYSIDIKNQEPHILIHMLNADELKPALYSPDGLYNTMFKQCFKPYVLANVLMDTLPENRVYSSDELSRMGSVPAGLYRSDALYSNNIFYNGKKVIGIEKVCTGTVKGLKPQLPEEISIELEDGTVTNVGVLWEDDNTKYKRSKDYELHGELIGLEVKIDKAERDEFKTAWLAISYGASIMSIREYCKVIDGNRVYKFITGIKGINNYRKETSKHAKSSNVVTTYFGSKVSTEYEDQRDLKRKLLNLPIQGTGADILSLLINRFNSYINEKELVDKLDIYYTRHDELIIEVDNQWENQVGEDKVKETLADILEHQIDDWLPFKLEINKIELS